MDPSPIVETGAWCPSRSHRYPGAAVALRTSAALVLLLAGIAGLLALVLALALPYPSEPLRLACAGGRVASAARPVQGAGPALLNRGRQFSRYPPADLCFRSMRLEAGMSACFWNGGGFRLAAGSGGAASGRPRSLPGSARRGSGCGTESPGPGPCAAAAGRLKDCWRRC